ncbi:alpha/beta hydrolase [Microbacterium flavum]|uniref:alpha/beta hydrolase n=1 Tax=Microbacterium flavum TaxID=415216 RepID=UPI0024ADE9E0|nr:alpha/beta hydrolase-fold protein [Microbacterium flavum]
MDLTRLPIADGAVPVTVFVLAVALIVVLAVRRWTPRALRWAVGGAILGAVLGYGAYRVVNVTNVFGDAAPTFVWHWAAAAFAASGFALGGLVAARAWRRVVSIVAVVVFLLAGVLGANMRFGLNPTLGSLFGITSTIDLPTDSGDATGAPSTPLYESWTSPAGMPAVGQRGSQTIPATVSGFDARPAGIYLPPAALVKDAPALPLVVMMMGHPGGPDGTVISDVLDTFAAQHAGLAPIVVVADQLGAAVNDTACADSDAYGKARTYVTVDVVNWAMKNLHVIDDPAYWTIAGYSNGGGCAITFGAQDPQLWKNILDVSGEPFPGSEQPANITKVIYGGNGAAFEASKPVNILAAAAPGSYSGMTAVFTAGSADPEYMASADTVAAAARSAGMTVVRADVPGAGHTGDALSGGLSAGFTVLFPVLGLSAPAG